MELPNDQQEIELQRGTQKRGSGSTSSWKGPTEKRQVEKVQEKKSEEVIHDLSLPNLNKINFIFIF